MQPSPEDLVALVETFGRAQPVVDLDRGSRHYTLAKKLEALDLVAIHVPRRNDMKLRLVVFEMVDALMEFVWDDELGSVDYEGFKTDPWTWQK